MMPAGAWWWRRYSRHSTTACNRMRYTCCANGQPTTHRLFGRPSFIDQGKQSLFSSRYLLCTTTNHEEKQLLETTTDCMTGWTVHKTLVQSTLRLQRADAPEPELSVAHLLAYALGLSWETGFVELLQRASSNTNDDALLKQRTLTSNEANHFSNMLQRRIKKEPLQYILGKWDFLDYTFQIRPPLLCPRPETEELVLKVMEDVKQNVLSGNSSSVRILDIGCGTGVIGISLAALFSGEEKKHVQVVAIDVEPIAISTSKDNALAILGECNTNRYQTILCSAAAFVNDGTTAPFDVIVSNPPYIPEQDMETLHDDVAKYESHQALCGGTDGMDVIREIILHSPLWCRPGAVIWMEVDPTHPKLLRDWLDSEASSLGVVFVSVHQDLYGRDRFVKLQIREHI